MFVAVKLLDRISNNRPVPKAAIRRYQIGVARALRILAGESNEQDSQCEMSQNSEISDAEKGDDNILSISPKKKTGQDRRVSWVIPEGVIPEEQIDKPYSEKGETNISSDIQKNTTEIPPSSSGDFPTVVSGTVNNRQDHRVSFTGSHQPSPFGKLGRRRSSAMRFSALPSFVALETMKEFEYSETMELNNSAYYFKDLKSVEEQQNIDSKEKIERGVFLRTDVAFDPDSKARFWYNSVNVMGCYAGLAMYSCIVSEKNVEFKPTYKVAAAFYATGITFSLIVSLHVLLIFHYEGYDSDPYLIFDIPSQTNLFIIKVYTRTVLRSMLNRTHFKVVRKFMYFFIGLFTYGLFPLSYTGLENNIENS